MTSDKTQIQPTKEISKMINYFLSIHHHLTEVGVMHT